MANALMPVEKNNIPATPRRPPGGRTARAVARKLREQIVADNNPGGKLPSERQLADRYRCAVKTVRAALTVLAGQGFIERLPGSGTYVSDPLPRLNQTTGVLFYGHAGTLLTQSFCRNVLRGLLDATAGTSQQTHLILGREKNPAAITSSAIAELGLERFNSVVGLEVFNHDLLEQLAEKRPVVSVDFPCHRPGVSSCALDHAQTVNLAIEQLWRLGHRRIAYAGPDPSGALDPAHGERVRAFKRGMEKRGLYLPHGAMMKASTTADRVLFAEIVAKSPPPDRPTAIISCGAEWLLAEGLVRFGLNIPADVSMISIDVPPPWLAYFTPTAPPPPYYDVGKLLGGPATDQLDSRLTPLRMLAFSAVELPFYAMGTWAMGEVLRRLADPDALAEFKTFPGSFRPGNTIGPPPA